MPAADWDSRRVPAPTGQSRGSCPAARCPADTRRRRRSLPSGSSATRDRASRRASSPQRRLIDQLQQPDEIVVCKQRMRGMTSRSRCRTPGRRRARRRDPAAAPPAHGRADGAAPVLRPVRSPKSARCSGCFRFRQDSTHWDPLRDPAAGGRSRQRSPPLAGCDGKRAVQRYSNGVQPRGPPAAFDERWIFVEPSPDLLPRRRRSTAV